MAGKAAKTPTTHSPSLTTYKTKAPCLNDDWTRPDGRGLHQCRPAFFRTWAVNTASGSASAYAEFVNTKVIASVGGINVLVPGDLPVVISCASLALADAGIMMYDILFPQFLWYGSYTNMQPSVVVLVLRDGSLMASCMPSPSEVTQLIVTGDWSTPTLDEGMQLCLDACAELGKIMRSCLRDGASASQEQNESFC